MGNVGFTARSSGGFAVNFEKRSTSPHSEPSGGSDSEGEATKNTRINFHKPHPVSKIDPVMIRGMGGGLVSGLDGRGIDFSWIIDDALKTVKSRSITINFWKSDSTISPEGIHY